jgi:hypothetical protein
MGELHLQRVDLVLEPRELLTEPGDHLLRLDEQLGRVHRRLSGEAAPHHSEKQGRRQHSEW